MRYTCTRTKTCIPSALSFTQEFDRAPRNRCNSTIDAQARFNQTLRLIPIRRGITKFYTLENELVDLSRVIGCIEGFTKNNWSSDCGGALKSRFGGIAIYFIGDIINIDNLYYRLSFRGEIISTRKFDFFKS